MIKIKTDTNPKLIKNFNNESFPDICIITSSGRYNLTLAYLSIDADFFNALSPQVHQVNLSHLPEKQLLQVLRALYGDPLTVYNVGELEMIYRVIQELRIEEYKEAIVEEIRSSRELMENLEILQFCAKNDLIVCEVKKLHIENNLRALESNRNFLQLSKISISTLIPLLNEYFKAVREAGASVINNILENYFNRNNIKPAQFFEQQDDVEIMLNIWQQFHHILHIERRPMVRSAAFTEEESRRCKDPANRMGLSVVPKTKEEASKIREKDARIAELMALIQEKDKAIENLRKQLYSYKNELEENEFKSKKKTTSHPILPLDEDDEEISLVEMDRPVGKLQLKNIKSDANRREVLPPIKLETKTPNRLGHQKITKLEF